MSISNGFPGIVKLATPQVSGLMSSSDKIKLDSINTQEISQAKKTLEELKNAILPTKIYTIRIDLNTKDPFKAVTYANDASGFEPLYINQVTGECNYGSWKEIIDTVIRPKPCILKGNTVVAYLDPDDYTRTVYGSGIDITTGNVGDVMVEFSRLPYKLEKNGNIVEFSIATLLPDDSWSYGAFTSEDGLIYDRDYMYYGAYEGWVDDNNKLRSLSGKIPTANRPLFGYRSYARNNGNTCSVESISKRMYISLLTMLVTKSMNIKSSIGIGVCDLEYTGDNRAIQSGTMNLKGLFYGNNSGKDGMKVFGIENFIGNLAEFIEGLSLFENQLYAKHFYPYNDTASGYTLIGQYPPVGSGWVKSVEVFNGLLIPSEYDAASSDYFTSYVYMPEDSKLSYVCSIGGSFYMNQSCGLLCMDFRYEPESSSQATGARLISC